MLGAGGSFNMPSNSYDVAGCPTSHLGPDTVHPESAPDPIQGLSPTLHFRCPWQSPGCYLCFLPTGYKLEVPMMPLPGLN